MRLRVGVLEGCCLLLNLGWLNIRLLSAEGLATLKFIAFEVVGGSTYCRWSTGEEADVSLSTSRRLQI